MAHLLEYDSLANDHFVRLERYSDGWSITGRHTDGHEESIYSAHFDTLIERWEELLCFITQEEEKTDEA